MELLQQGFIYLAAAVIAVPIANRLGLGSVLGYLIAGVVIGPLLGVVGAESEAVKHFAEFGVVMMLFLVGLELQPRQLWQMRGQLLGLGGLQVALTTLAFTGVAMALDVDWRTALAAGMILSLSSTAIVLQTLDEKGLIKTPGGRASFSVLLFQDIAVIPMLALLPLLAHPGLVGLDGGHGDPHGSPLAHLPGWLQTLIILAVIGAIILAGRFLTRPVFRFIAAARLREIFTAAALLLVIAIALVMQAIGLSPALGTFLAGVVLSGSEYRHELESDIGPFKGLLLGLFFISVGAGVDFGLLFGEPALVIGLALAIMFGKFLVLLLLSKLFRLAAGDNWLFALGLAQSGEFAFVLFGFAGGAGVLAEPLLGQLTLAVALSMLLTPPLFILWERLIAPRLADGEAREADTIEQPGNVVIAGFGRFGQTIGRLLSSQGHGTVFLDHDPSLIEMLRKFGLKTHYGDATRPDLLEAAGMAEARLLVAALDDRERQTELVRYVVRHFPQARIIARAIDRPHVYELDQAGAHYVVRELFDASLDAGRQGLVELGMHPFAARRKAQAFRRQDLEMIARMSALWRGTMDQDYIDQARVEREALQRVLSADEEERHDTTDRGWTPPP